MNRERLAEFIKTKYGAEAEYPWGRYPGNAVFRHQSNKKWFALVMNIKKSCLGREGDGNIDVVNVKCDPLLVGALRGEKGFYPAYHMNKEQWLTISLSGDVPPSRIKELIELSYQLTLGKK